MTPLVCPNHVRAHAYTAPHPVDRHVTHGQGHNSLEGLTPLIQKDAQFLVERVCSQLHQGLMSALKDWITSEHQKVRVVADRLLFRHAISHRNVGEKFIPLLPTTITEAFP